MSALATLIDAGLTLRADGNRLIVAPAALLTEGLRCLIRENKAELLASVINAERLAADLVAAINRCCDLRGDDAANRVGLICECPALPPASQADMQEHFQQQAAVWSTATGQAPR